MSKKILQNIFILFSAMLTWSCAGQVPPGGGPLDTTPPTIIRTVPDSNAVHVKDNSVELEFSEYVDRRTVEESIFISPYVGELEFDWSGTGVTIQFSEPLKENRTYVVNVGTDVVDLRAHNRMASGFTLAFSSGDSIDHGMISGRVFDEKPEGVMIFAYLLSSYNPDTLDPSKVKPDYIMQTGKNGLFRLSNIAYGRYRVLAVRDEYKNLLYDKQVDQFGVTVGDTAVTYANPEVSGLWYRLSQEDTTKPFLTNVKPANNRRIMMRFSEPLDSISFERGVFTVIDTVEMNAVPLLLWSLNSVSPSLVDLITETPLDSGVAYRCTARNVFDRVGNPIDTANASVVFEGIATPDTVRPVAIVRGMADSAKGIPLDQTFWIDFSEPVLHSPLDSSIVLRDSSKTTVRSTLHWSSAANLQLSPVALLHSKEWYEILVPLDSVRDYAGNTWKDTTMLVRFQSLDLRTTGTIEGDVVDEQKEGKGQIYVTASSVDLTPPRARTILLSEPGSFTIDRIPEGKYVLKGFRDADSSGSYSFGKPFPFVPSERFVVSTDTIRVRARWGAEGVTLKFK